MDIQSALTTITALGELTKLVINGKVDEKVKAKAAELTDSIISLQGTIFSIQSQNHELLNAKREIEEKLITLSNWDNTEKRYLLNEICPGVFVYSLNEEHQKTEPFHHICPNCYANRKQSILIKSETSHSGTKYKCKSPDCNAEYNDYTTKKPIPSINTRHRNFT